MKRFMILIYMCTTAALIFYAVYFILLYKQSNTILINSHMSQKEINKILATYKNVKFTNGIYNIDAEIGLNLSSNQVVIFDDKAEIRAIPNDKERYEIIKLNNIRNTTISGGRIVGERYTHKWTNGEWGMGIAINDCTNIKVENMVIRDCWGDGIYLGASNYGYNENIEIINCKIDNNRRQGISVISAINLGITNTEIMNTNGTNPQAGIDFEPNYPTQRLEKIIVKNLYTFNTTEVGILIVARSIPYIDIRIKEHRHDGGIRRSGGITIDIGDVSQTGKIENINPVYTTTTKGQSVHINRKKSRVDIQIKNLTEVPSKK